MGECTRVANTKKNSQTVRDGSDRSNIVVEPLPSDKFHGVENAAVRECAHIVNGHDAGVLESGQYARLANQPDCEIAICSGDIHYLQGHAALEAFIFRGIHDVHAAACDALEQSI